MNSKLNLPVGVALFAALAVGLMFLLSGGLLQAQETTTTIEYYEENDTAAVATYNAVDPEMTAITSWSLAGTDAGFLRPQRAMACSASRSRPTLKHRATDKVGTGVHPEPQPWTTSTRSPSRPWTAPARPA